MSKRTGIRTDFCTVMTSAPGQFVVAQPLSEKWAELCNLKRLNSRCQLQHRAGYSLVHASLCLRRRVNSVVSLRRGVHEPHGGAYLVIEKRTYNKNYYEWFQARFTPQFGHRGGDSNRSHDTAIDRHQFSTV